MKNKGGKEEERWIMEEERGRMTEAKGVRRIENY